MDHDFRCYITHWSSLTKIIPLISDKEIEAEAKMLRLIMIQRTLSNWSRWINLPEYQSWIRTIGEYVYHIRSEAPGWYLKSDYLWQLHNEYVASKMSDELAWAAATNPEAEICETDISCYFRALRASIVKYLIAHPDGKYVPLALAHILEFTERFRTIEFFRERLREIFSFHQGDAAKFFEEMKADIRKSLKAMQECLLSTLRLNPDSRTRHVYRIFEETFNGYLSSVGADPPTGQNGRIADGVNKSNQHDEIERIVHALTRSYDLDLAELMTTWHRVNEQIPLINNLSLSILAQYARLLSLNRILNLVDVDGCHPPEFDDLVRRNKDLIRNNGVSAEEFWKLADAAGTLPIADDIAWEASIQKTSTISDQRAAWSEYEFQLRELSETIGRYVLQFPEGKYSSIALERVSDFINICMKQDPLVPTPNGVEEPALQALHNLKAQIKRVVLRSDTPRAVRTLAKLEEFERYLKKK